METTMAANGERVVTVEFLKQTRIARAQITLNADGKVTHYRTERPDGTAAQDREYTGRTIEPMDYRPGIAESPLEGLREDIIWISGERKLFQHTVSADDWAALVALCA